MLRKLLIISIGCSPIFLGVNGRAQEPTKKGPAELLPAPKTQITPKYEIVPSYEIAPYESPFGSREVWQHYGPNSQGRFVPRVILTPYGALYSRNLQPYPWLQNRPTAIMPYARD